MDIYNLMKSGVSANIVVEQFVENYLNSELGINDAMVIFLNFLIQLSTDSKKKLCRQDILIMEKLNLQEIFENFGPGTIENLLDCDEYDFIVISMFKYMCWKRDNTVIYQHFLKKIKKFFNLMLHSDIKGMLDLSVFFSLTFTKGIFENFCNVNDNFEDRSSVWCNICGEYMALGYIGQVSPYFGYNALDRICYIHECTLNIFKCDPDFFIKFIKGLKFKVTRICSRILNSLKAILTNPRTEESDLNSFKCKLMENCNFIFSMFIQNKTKKTIKLYIIIFESLTNFILSEQQKLELFSKINRHDRDGTKELALFLINQMRRENLSDKKIFLFILFGIKRNKSTRNLTNFVEAIWDDLPFINDPYTLFVYFLKLEDVDLLCSIVRLLASITEFLNKNYENHEEKIEKIQKFLHFVLQNQKKKLNFRVIDLLMEILNNINMDLFNCNRFESDLHFKNLLEEMLDLSKYNVMFKNNLKDELFIKKIFDIIDKFYLIERAKNEINNFVLNLFEEFFLIIKIVKTDKANQELCNRFLILNIEISEIIFHNFGVENIEFDNLIKLYFEEFKAEGVFMRILSQYKEYSIMAYAIKSYCDCICLIRETVGLSVSNEINRKLNILGGSLIEFVIAVNCTIKNINFIAKSTYALMKLISILHEIASTTDNQLDNDHLLWYYEKTVELVFKSIFTDSISWDSTSLEIEMQRKVILQLFLELHRTYVPNSNALWKFLRIMGSEQQQFNTQLTILIEHLLQNFKNIFVKIYAFLLYNINVNDTETYVTAIFNIRKIYNNKYPLKATEPLKDSFLGIEGATILSLLQIIYDKLVLKYESRNQEGVFEENNILNCLDFIHKNFLEYFRLQRENALSNQMSVIYRHYFHLMNAEEKQSFRNFQKIAIK